MLGKIVVVLAVAALLVAGTSYWLASNNHASFSWLGEALPMGRSLQSEAKTFDASLQPHTTQQVSPPPPGDNALGFMLASVADQYVENAHYPAWSTPLTPAQAEGYRGNRYEPVSLPLGNNGHFTVTLEQYRFTRGESILVAASIQGPQVVTDRLELSLENSLTRDTVASAQLIATDGDGFYEGSIDSNESPGEYRLIAEANIDGKKVRHVSTLTIEPFLGTFDGLEASYIANNNLVIPLRFEPDQPGFYSLSAQLYAGQQPIALLQAEQRLDLTTDTIDLKAHGTVLADRQLKGPMSLRHLQIRQLPAKPGERTHYAFGPDEGYSFSPPDLDSLRDTPASDYESEQRAALLRQLADKF